MLIHSSPRKPLRAILLIAASLTLTVACGSHAPAQTTPRSTPPTAQPTTTAAVAAEPTSPEPTSSDPTSSSRPYTVDEAGAASLALVDKIVAAVTSAGNDCAKIGANLMVLLPECKAVSKRAAHLDDDPAQKKAFQEQYGTVIEKKMVSALTAVQRCRSTAEVEAFFTALGED